MPDHVTDMLDAWGAAERHDAKTDSNELPPAIRDAVAHRRGDGAPVVLARLTFARWAPLAAAVLLAAMAGMVVTRHSTPAPTTPNIATLPQRASSFTLIGVMRANDGFASEDLVLPDAGVVAWTSRTSPLQ